MTTCLRRSSGGALNALHRRELLTVQSHLGELWLRPTWAILPGDLPAHERTLLERVTACATRLPGPVPLGALRPGPTAGVRRHGPARLCLHWTRSVVLSPTGRTALSRAPTEPTVRALEHAEMPVSYVQGEVWSTATGAWRRLPVRDDHPRGGVRSPLRVRGRVVRCIPKTDDKPCHLVVDDTVSDVAYKYRVTPYQFERAPLGSWVSLKVPHGRRSFSDVTVLARRPEAPHA